MNLAEAIEPLVKLNAWARSEFKDLHGMDRAKAAIYSMKNRVILAAIEADQCDIRIVATERKCKTCNGTGTYVWQSWTDPDDERYEDCRRCAGTPGKVLLKFVETSIWQEGNFGWKATTFHVPLFRDRADFLKPAMANLKLDTDKPEATDWTPEQPGRELSRREVIVALNELERAVFWPRRIRWHDGWSGSVFDYPLDFGHIRECFVCGQDSQSNRPYFGGQPCSSYTVSYGQEIYRPGMRWRQSICDEHKDKAERWPRQWPANLQNPKHDRGRWISEMPAWPMNAPLPPMADTDVVREWLARRGIVVGELPPADCGFVADTGEFVTIVGHVPETGQIAIQYGGSQTFRPWHAEDVIPTAMLQGWPLRRITNGG